ncbi:MAG: hypothetical protein JO311_00700 [Candidatus Eremiobacteraeota bacterium]|nr:hypothetical protein [Candidatus Eremiobacteraeota bacterium]MBV9264390.1 hypothetical protein [Candidatus Eremiobacteraeota bacterium]
MAWTLTVDRVIAPRDAASLRDPLPLLERLQRAFGQRAVSRLLDVGAGTVANWMSGKRSMSAPMIKRVIDLHDVFSRALQIYEPQVVVDWLLGNDRYLDGRRPIDVLVLEGAGPLVEALDGHASLGYP